MQERVLQHDAPLLPDAYRFLALPFLGCDGGEGNINLVDTEEVRLGSFGS